MTTGLYYRLGRFFPGKWNDTIKRKLRQGGRKEDPETWLGKTTVLGIISIIVGGLLGVFFQPFIAEWVIARFDTLVFSPLLGFITGAILGIILYVGGRGYSLYVTIENRRERVENILPDFLLLVAGNIRAGMTSFSAVKSSTRPEFGPLSEELRSATTHSLGTGSFGNALVMVNENIRSRQLDETIRFFIQATRSGGKVAQLLENTALDLRRTQELKKEMETSTKTYTLFVAFVMVIATPLLMAVSVEFVRLISTIQSQTALSGANTASLGFIGGTLTITPLFLEGIAYILLLGNAILAGLFMGIISRGKPWLGLRYTPIMFGVCVVVFWLARGVLAGLLGGAV